MKKKLIITFIILFYFIFFNECLLTQSYLFTVVASTKNVYKKTASGKDWKEVNTGEKLFSSDRVKINKNGYLGLAYISGETVELKKEGSYLVSDLKKNVTANNSSLLKKFSDYVINEIVIAQDEKTTDDHGAVFRVRKNYLDVDFPKVTSLFDTSVQFKWYKYENEKNFVFKLINSDRVTLYLQKLNDTSLTIDLRKLNLGKDTAYYWYLYLPNDDQVCSDTNSIRIISGKKSNEILNEINELEKSSQQRNNSLNNIILAKYCEEKGLNKEALKYFETAVKLTKSVDEFKNLYIQFLFRNNLFKRLNLINNN